MWVQDEVVGKIMCKDVIGIVKELMTTEMMFGNPEYQQHHTPPAMARGAAAKDVIAVNHVMTIRQTHSLKHWPERVHQDESTNSCGGKC